MRKCTSRLMMEMITSFCEAGGLDKVYRYLEETPAAEMDLNIFSSIMSCVSSPIIIYHKDVVSEYGPKFAAIAEEKLKGFPDKLLRNVRREKIEGIIKAIDVL